MCARLFFAVVTVFGAGLAAGGALAVTGVFGRAEV